MIGSTLSHYRVLESLGAGGMGEVYRAQDEVLRRNVALKVLPPAKTADEKLRLRLLKEARLASALNHPDICTIFEVGDEGGEMFIAMEYVKGKPLDAVIPKEGLLAATATRYGVQIADALEHAHAHGIIHRDLKCRNVMVTPEGRIKVLDFGLALQSEAADLEAVTRSNDSSRALPGLAGTLPYIAPELLRGDPPNQQSDVWSLGVMLYEMVAGARPFQGATGFELSSSILKDPPPPLPERVPAALAAVVHHCLQKVPGERYQHAGEVKAALEALLPVMEDTRSSAAIQTPVVTPVRSLRNWLWLAAALLAATLLAVFWRVSTLRERTPVGSAPIQSVAVLPLADVAADPSQQFFADGMTEALITDLSKIRALRVISRASVMQYRGTQKPVHQIGRELNVDAAVSGTVVRSQNRVRISVELADARTDRNLWAENYEGDLQDVLGLQSRIAQAIAHEVQAQLTPLEHERLASTRTVNPQAYDAYLQGHYHLHKDTEQEWRKAQECFAQAIQLDPNYAAAYAGLAAYYWMTDELRPEVAMRSAKEFAMKALEMDPTLAEAHTALGNVRFYADWNWAEAENEFKRGLEMGPSDAETHRLYATFLSAMGRAPEALSELQTAQGLDPLSLSAKITTGWTLYYAHRYDEALGQCRMVLDLEPNSAGAHDCLGLAYLAKGMLEKAQEECQKAFTLSGNGLTQSVGLARARAFAGNKAYARLQLEELSARARESFVPQSFFAQIHVALGDMRQAQDWLQVAYAKRDPYLVRLKVDPAFDAVRSEPFFQEIIRHLNFPS